MGMRRIVLLLIMIGLALLLASGVALAAALSSSPDPRTVQTDGAVRTILRVGSKVYIGGSFTSVAGKPRSNLAAINANTGRLTGWAPKANGQVRAPLSVAPPTATWSPSAPPPGESTAGGRPALTRRSYRWPLRAAASTSAAGFSRSMAGNRRAWRQWMGPQAS